MFRTVRPALVAALVATLLGLPASLSAARAQDRSITLDLVGQPLWRVDPGDPLGLRLRIANRDVSDLEGLQLVFAAGERVDSRTALHDSFSDPLSFLQTSSFARRFFTRTVEGGTSTTFSIDDPVGRLDTLERAETGGVYPLVITLYDAEGNELDVTTTQILYYPSPPQVRLNFVLVLPLSTVPARAPGGTFLPDPASGGWPLAEALSARGWLRGLLRALGEHRGLNLGLAPTPRLLEEIADMQDGYVRAVIEGSNERVDSSDRSARDAASFLKGLRRVLRRPTVQPLLIPYSAPDLPALSRQPSAEVGLSRQIAAGHEVLGDVLGTGVGARFSPAWLFPPAGRLDEPTLDSLRLSFATAPEARLNTFFAADSLEEPSDLAARGCPRPELTFACPVRIEGPDGLVQGFAADSGLTQRLAALDEPGDDRLDLQRFFAETAMIREEIPGVAERVVQATVPSHWHPAPRISESLLGGLENAPWLRSVTPARALEVVDPAPRAAVSVARELNLQPEISYYSTIERAAAIVADFALIEPQSPGLLRRLERNLLVSESRLWWEDEALLEEGRGYAAAAGAEARDQLDNIEVGGRTEITLTSERQPIPLVLFNKNPYAVEVEVHLESQGLDFDGPARIRVPLAEGNKPFTVEAAARSSGVFPLRVAVRPPGSETVIAARNIVVRSTQFNKIALGLTVGALAFLFFFYALRAARRRRDSSDDRPGAARA